MKKTIITSLVISSTVFLLGCEQKNEQTQQPKEITKVEEKLQEENVTTPESTQETVEKQEQKVEQLEQEQLSQTTQETPSKEEPKEEVTTQTTPKTEDSKEQTTSQEEKAGVSGENIFKSKGCAVCHHPEIDTTGPSLKKISQFYKDKKQELISFLKGQGDPIVDPAKFTIMKPQINITKNMSDEELNALVDYLLSF